MRAELTPGQSSGTGFRQIADPVAELLRRQAPEVPEERLAEMAEIYRTFLSQELEKGADPEWSATQALEVVRVALGGNAPD